MQNVLKKDITFNQFIYDYNGKKPKRQFENGYIHYMKQSFITAKF